MGRCAAAQRSAENLDAASAEPEILTGRHPRLRGNDEKKMNFERTTRRKPLSPNLTPLIDVLFILIIFFMLTTSFMRIESLELILPSVGGKAAKNNDVVHLFIYEN